MDKLKKFQGKVSRHYFSLTIDQKINLRQHRNSLNINYLFSTVINDLNMGITDKQDEGKTYPPVNNGIYHHAGKNHSQYPIVKGGRTNYNQREEQIKGIYR